MNKGIKILISFFLTCFAPVFLVLKGAFERLVAIVCFIGGVFYWWRKELKEWIVDKLAKYKLIREKKMYYVTEKGYLTDLKSRQEIDQAVFSVIYGSYIPMYIVTFFTMKIQFPEVVQYIIWTILILGIILLLRCYIPSLLYYSVPLVSSIILFSINDFEHISSTKSIVFFLITSIVLYALLTLIIPLHTIRKISDRSWLVGVLISLLISLLLQYITGIMMKDIYSSVYEYREVTIEAFEKSGASFEFITFLKSNPLVMEILKGVQHDLYDLLKYKNLATASSIFSLVSFLSISSYSLGKILFDLKLRLGESKAKDIYEKIENQENVDYEDLRDCIFYGGEKYQDKIFSNREYKKTIISTEQGFEFYVEERNWVIRISHFTQNVVGFLKKLI